MSLFGKLEVDVEIKAPADKFHDVFSRRPHIIPNISPKNVQGFDLLEGEIGKEGAIVNWSYTHDGVAKVAKDKIEAIDDVNLSITYTVIEGDLKKEFKNFKVIIKAIPKGEGSVVHLTFEYEKLHQGISDPQTLLDLLVEVTNDIDAYLIQAYI